MFGGEGVTTEPECTHGIVSEDDSWDEVTVLCLECGKRMSFEEWKDSQHGVSRMILPILILALFAGVGFIYLPWWLWWFVPIFLVWMSSTKAGLRGSYD